MFVLCPIIFQVTSPFSESPFPWKLMTDIWQPAYQLSSSLQPNWSSRIVISGYLFRHMSASQNISWWELRELDFKEHLMTATLWCDSSFIMWVGFFALISLHLIYSIVCWLITFLVQGGEQDAILTVKLNDMGNYGCYFNCDDKISVPLQAEASVNLIRRRPMSSLVAHGKW